MPKTGSASWFRLLIFSLPYPSSQLVFMLLLCSLGTASSLSTSMILSSPGRYLTKFGSNDISNALKTELAMQSESITSGGKHEIRVAVIGGGASGMFAATTLAEVIQRTKKEQTGSDDDCIDTDDKNADIRVSVYEASHELMSKIRTSAGGRGNVLHDTMTPIKETLKCYPRGQREISGLLTKRFSPVMAQRWFESRGVVFKTEADGRMFPVTDDSQTVIDAVYRSASEAGVQIFTDHEISHVERTPEGNGGFVLVCGEKEEHVQRCDCLILATGDSIGGHQIASSLGHGIITPVPSLFDFKLSDEAMGIGGVFHDLSDLVLPHARIGFKLKILGQTKARVLKQEGSILITEMGLSGQAPLKLSSFAAREFHGVNYTGHLNLHLAPDIGSVETIEAKLLEHGQEHKKELVTSNCPLYHRKIDYDNYDIEKGVFLEVATQLIPQRLWANLCRKSGLKSTSRWSNVSPKQYRAISDLIVYLPLKLVGKSPFREESAVAGGIQLKEVDMRTMQSKVADGLFCCGGVIDVDGINGGYNFIQSWGTGYVAGTSAAQYALDLVAEKRRSESVIGD